MVYFRPAIGCRLEGDGNSKLMIYNLERAIRLMPRNTWQYTIIIDCHGENKALVAIFVFRPSFFLVSSDVLRRSQQLALVG